MVAVQDHNWMKDLADSWNSINGWQLPSCSCLGVVPIIRDNINIICSKLKVIEVVKGFTRGYCGAAGGSCKTNLSRTY
jgi:hypothetical protein